MSFINFDDDGEHTREMDDDDTASQRSISLSSTPDSPQKFSVSPIPLSPQVSQYTLDTRDSSEADDTSIYNSEPELDSASELPSKSPPLYAYPPPPVWISGHRDSVSSSATGSSSYSKKARPESMLMDVPVGPLVLGIALVDFNHAIGPTIEFSRGEVFEDEDIVKILPFLALPDGAHLASEDYTYFHLVPKSPNPSTIFGISCNRQIATSTLLVKDDSVTRSTVQKAVVLLASKPVFGPIRDRLGVVTLALFEQRNFMELDILDEFYSSIDVSLKSQLTMSGLYMGTSLRELVHKFRQRTLVLLKALMLQKRIMFYGHPVERLCTYQYSLISLIPGLLQHLEDSGSPPLASRAPTLTKPSSLKTSDHKSMTAYLGLPLDLFGKDAFFQPYLPLQQLDMIKESRSWLCGSTNSIVTQQKEVDLLVNIESGTIEFRDPRVERSAGLTPADRKWMDDIVRDVNEEWLDEDDMLGSQSKATRAVQFKGSDDYLRQKFEEYISGALSSVKYADFLAKGQGNGVVISEGSGGDLNSIPDFNMLWISEFKRTNAYEVWDRITDLLIFDIVEPRHPCAGKPSVVEDISLRLQEGLQDLKLEQQLAPTREALSKTFASGSSNFLKAVEGVRGKWMQRSSSPGSAPGSGMNTPPVDLGKVDGEKGSPPLLPASQSAGVSPMMSDGGVAMKNAIGSWGSGIGSFLAARGVGRFSLSGAPSESEPPPTPQKTSPRTVPPTIFGGGGKGGEHSRLASVDLGASEGALHRRENERGVEVDNGGLRSHDREHEEDDAVVGFAM